MAANRSGHNAGLLKDALIQAVLKLNPAVQIRNPVMFVVFCGSVGTTTIGLLALLNWLPENPLFVLAVSI